MILGYTKLMKPSSITRGDPRSRETDAHLSSTHTDTPVTPMIRRMQSTVSKSRSASVRPGFHEQAGDMTRTNHDGQSQVTPLDISISRAVDKFTTAISSHCVALGQRVKAYDEERGKTIVNLVSQWSN